jgi:hypothetical protein
MGLEVHDPIDSDFAAFAQARRMKDRGSSGDEYFILDGAAHHMGIGPNEAIVPDGQWMTRRASEHCVFHDDALASDGNGTTFSDHLRTVHDAAAWSDRDIATHNCIGCHPSRWVDLWRNASMFNKQRILLGWT